MSTSGKRTFLTSVVWQNTARKELHTGSWSWFSFKNRQRLLVRLQIRDIQMEQIEDNAADKAHGPVFE